MREDNARMKKDKDESFNGGDNVRMIIRNNVEECTKNSKNKNNVRKIIRQVMYE